MTEEQRFICTEYPIVSNAIKHLAGVQCSSDNPLEILIRPYVEKRSEAQRRTLWGWYYKNLSKALNDAGYCIEDDDGHEWPYTADLLHEILREYFLCYGEIKRNGKVRKIIWSTNDLPKSRSNHPFKPTFSEYIDKIKEFASQHWNIELADPVSGLMRSYFDECYAA